MALNFGKIPQTVTKAPIGATPTPVAAPVARSHGSIFAGIEGAKASFGANYVRKGHYLMVVRNAKHIVTRKGAHAVVFELTCAAVLNDLGNANPHREGEETTHYLAADKDSFLGNLKAAICGIGNCTEPEVTQEVLATCIMEPNSVEFSPLAKLCVELVATDITTREGNPFTRVDYKRQIAPSELGTIISQKAADLIFGKGGLEALIAEEQARG
jgi:hypothetical protein